MGKVLKYQQEIQNAKLSSDCPNEGVEVSILAYRFTNEDISHANNWEPTFIVDKIRNRPPRTDNCNAFGMSMYDSEVNAKIAFSRIPPRNRKMMQLHYIAKGTIEKDDGLTTNINERGHFGFYQYKKTSIQENFEIIDLDSNGEI